jgi:nicotinate-nucleotide adenylyltransferase
MKIGIFGGTFDPIHYGHLRVAETAREALGLDRVLFIPLGEPVHRTAAPHAVAEDRYAMCLAATLENPSFDVSRIEVDRPGGSYSVETLRILREERPGDEFVLIIGADEAAIFPTWREPCAILEMARLAVVTRPGTDAAALERELPEWVWRKMEVLPPLYVDISATDVRRRIAEGSSVRYRVPPGVAAYIAKHDLYRKEE